jgi:hypothetical protein
MAGRWCPFKPLEAPLQAPWSDRGARVPAEGLLEWLPGACTDSTAGSTATGHQRPFKPF